MTRVTYVAVFEAGDDGIGVTFPDLPGCVSWGEDEDLAVREAHDALSLHLEGLAEEGLPIPPPASMVKISQHVARTYFSGAIPHMLAAITVEAPDTAERVNIYLAKSILERIDAYCSERAISRSAFFVQAAKAQLAVMRPLPSAGEIAARARAIAEKLA